MKCSFQLNFVKNITYFKYSRNFNEKHKCCNLQLNFPLNFSKFKSIFYFDGNLAKNSAIFKKIFHQIPNSDWNLANSLVFFPNFYTSDSPCKICIPWPRNLPLFSQSPHVTYKLQRANKIWGRTEATDGRTSQCPRKGEKYFEFLPVYSHNNSFLQSVGTITLKINSIPLSA